VIIIFLATYIFFINEKKIKAITICSGQLLPVTIQEEFEDTIEVIRIRKSMDR
jgi:hypothetical protein